MKFPKAKIPQPKYNLGDQVIYYKPSEGNYPPKRVIGQVEQIFIHLTPVGGEVSYLFEGTDEEMIVEDAISRRALA